MKKALLILILFLLALTSLAACGMGEEITNIAQQAIDEALSEVEEAVAPPEVPADGDSGDTAIDEDGSYTTAEDVALYLHTYGRLPANFITKDEARKLGWEGGGLEEYAPGCCIGGDRFGNYEGLLPQGDYRECDIDTLLADKRSAKRLVWNEAGAIYYTDDHYESFSQLY